MKQSVLANAIKLAVASSAPVSFSATSASTIICDTFNAAAKAGNNAVAYADNPASTPSYPTDGWSYVNNKTDSWVDQNGVA